MKAVLVLNCGSSSIKFAVLTETDKSVVLEGLAERLAGNDEAVITVKFNGEKIKYDIGIADHEKALDKVVEIIDKNVEHTVVGIGHRVVSGGEQFKESCLVTDEVVKGIEDCIHLAPLHNPAHLAGIHAAKHAYPGLPQVVVFDTAFHQTIPESAYLYAVPYEYYEKYSLRRYGAHGTSYRYIAQAVKDYNAGKVPEKLIVCHLGNGASVSALKDGVCVHTSMGLTPLDGLVQGTRSGYVDPTVVSFLADHTGKTHSEITDELWKKSGLLGLSQLTNDCREIEDGFAKGDVACTRAFNAFNARLIEVVGSFIATLGGVDGIVFTGGIGENSSVVREIVMNNLGYCGFDMDKAKNDEAFRGKDGNVATADSKPIWVIPTNEEAMIAEDTLNLI